MGNDGADPENNEALNERASAAEICAYYDKVWHQRFLASGRVRFLSSTDHFGDGDVRSRVDGRATTVRFSKLVDATYIEGSIPATTPAPFEVVIDARCMPVGGLARMRKPARDFVVIGAGKTGQDACLWLLANGVSQDQIRWIRPRDPWIHTRLGTQPGPGLEKTIEIFSGATEAAALSSSVNELYQNLEDAGALVRIDRSVEPTCYAGKIISDRELEQLRRIKDVIRIGRVRSIEVDRIILEEGEVETSPDTLHIQCAAQALGSPPLKPVFNEDLITLQNLRYGLLPLSAAITGFVEATRSDDREKNALCQPFRYT